MVAIKFIAFNIIAFLYWKVMIHITIIVLVEHANHVSQNVKLVILMILVQHGIENYNYSEIYNKCSF